MSEQPTEGKRWFESRTVQLQIASAIASLGAIWGFELPVESAAVLVTFIATIWLRLDTSEPIKRAGE